MALEDLKPYSLSLNFFRQVVKPLHDSVHFEERSVNSLKKMLRDDIHKAFWREPSPMPYDSALAGKFQEILDTYKHAVLKDHHAQLGALAGVGGDTVVTKLNASGTEYTKTIQFKTVDSDKVRGVQENISKAGWQLCGHGGERPQDCGVNTIEIVLLNTVAFDSYTTEQWAHVIKEALDEGYRQNDIPATADELYHTVDQVKITTVNHRFTFEVDIDHTIHFISQKPTTTAHGYTFREKNFAKHWNWLKDTWWVENVQKHAQKSEVIQKTRNRGVGTSGAWQSLPTWPE